ncbi:MAG: hypothetical protein L3K07_02445 [Thermoplasmata archaeon]|nr:hypothetical protein [Thermoplasmata archaeon]
MSWLSRDGWRRLLLLAAAAAAIVVVLAIGLPHLARQPGPPEPKITILEVSWHFEYLGGAPMAFGPANQSLCSECPVHLNAGATFSVSCTLTNHDTLNRTIEAITLGNGPQFYIVHTSPTLPATVLPGQNVSVTLSLRAGAGTTSGAYTLGATVETR